jgi:hypothetical protein
MRYVLLFHIAVNIVADECGSSARVVYAGSRFVMLGVNLRFVRIVLSIAIIVDIGWDVSRDFVFRDRLIRRFGLLRLLRDRGISLHLPEAGQSWQTLRRMISTIVPG